MFLVRFVFPMMGASAKMPFPYRGILSSVPPKMVFLLVSAAEIKCFSMMVYSSTLLSARETKTPSQCQKLWIVLHIHYLSCFSLYTLIYDKFS